MSFLATILRHKAVEVADRRRLLPVERLMETAFFDRTPISLIKSITNQDFAVVAEVKKASPSKGELRSSFDPVAIAREYEAAGAAAISVLTDEEFFQGKLEYLEAIRVAVALPLLRKDFIIDDYQLYEAKACGADAVLLIVAALDAKRLGFLQERATSLGLECLVEVHTERELGIAHDAGSPLIGMNNRDLESFETDLGTSVRLAARSRYGTVYVSESGIGLREDLETLARAGIRAVLVGESFMRARSPGHALEEFLAMAKGVG